MQRWIALFVIVVLMALPVGRAVFAAPTEHSAELWHVSTIADPKTHKFSYCTVESGFDNGLYLAFARNRDLNTNIVVSFPDKRLEEKTKFRMLVAIDSYPVREMVGFSAANDTLVIPLQHDRKLIEWLQKGKLLDLKGPSDSAKFALDGAADALHQLQLCVENNLKAESASAGGKPEARPAVAIGPLAINRPPAEDRLDDHMVEPLPLPTTAPDSYAPTLAPPIGAPSSPPQQLASNQSLAPALATPMTAPLPKPLHTEAQTAPESEQAIEQSDEQAARAEAARLQARRQRQQVAMADTGPSDMARVEAAAAADAQRQAADDATEASLAKAPPSPGKAARLPPAPVQPPAPPAEDQVVVLPEPAPAPTPAPLPLPAPAPKPQPAPVEAVPVQTPAVVAAPAPAPQPKPIATDMVLDTPVEIRPSAPAVAPRPAPAPIPPPAPVAAASPVSPPQERPPVIAQPASPPVVMAPAQSLPGVLQQAGLSPRSQGKTPGDYVWNTGAVSGDAREVKAAKPFTDALLDDLDSREKTCRGRFSSTMEAPVQRGVFSYSNVTTGCGKTVGIILYYQANNKFGVIAQETGDGNLAAAETMRKRLSQVLQANYQ